MHLQTAMFESISMKSQAASWQRFQPRFRSFSFAFAGGFFLMFAVYLSPKFPGPALDLGSIVFWSVLSAAVASIPGVVGLLTPKWSRSVTFLLGAILGYGGLEAVLYWTRAWGSFDSVLFRWLYFG